MPVRSVTSGRRPQLVCEVMLRRLQAQRQVRGGKVDEIDARSKTAFRAYMMSDYIIRLTT